MAAVEKFGFHVATCCGYIPQVKLIHRSILTPRGTCTVFMYYRCVVFRSAISHFFVCFFFLPLQDNHWQSDWVSFYSQLKLQHQLNMVEKSYGDRETRELWAQLQVHSQFDPV